MPGYALGTERGFVPKSCFPETLAGVCGRETDTDYIIICSSEVITGFFTPSFLPFFIHLPSKWTVPSCAPPSCTRSRRVKIDCPHHWALIAHLLYTQHCARLPRGQSWPNLILALKGVPGPWETTDRNEGTRNQAEWRQYQALVQWEGMTMPGGLRSPPWGGGSLWGVS